jgi:hypothetical protein
MKSHFAGASGLLRTREAQLRLAMAGAPSGASGEA